MTATTASDKLAAMLGFLLEEGGLSPRAALGRANSAISSGGWKAWAESLPEAAWAGAAASFADAPAGGGGVPTNGAYEHTHEHTGEDGVTHAHNHWHYAGTTQHVNGTTISHDHEHADASPAAGSADRYEAGRVNRGDMPNPGSPVSSVTAPPVKSSEESNRRARERAFREVRLSPEQAAVVTMAEQQRLVKDEGVVPGSTIQKIQPGRQPLATPDPTRKPGEDDVSYYRRLRASIAVLGRPGASVGQAASSIAAPRLDSTRSDFADGGAEFQRRKRDLLASEKAGVGELVHQGTTAGSMNLAESMAIRSRALDVMKGRGQSTDPKAAEFREDYIAALRSLRGVK